MPNLGDFIGQLISELLIARAQADLESLRIAEMYKSDNILKHFSIPRFRLPTVNLDIPVAITKVGEITKDEMPGGKILFSDTIGSRIIQETENLLIKMGIKYTKTQLASAEKEINIYLQQALADVQTYEFTEIAKRIEEIMIIKIQNKV